MGGAASRCLVTRPGEAAAAQPRGAGGRCVWIPCSEGRGGGCPAPPRSPQPRAAAGPEGGMGELADGAAGKGLLARPLTEAAQEERGLAGERWAQRLRPSFSLAGIPKSGFVLGTDRTPGGRLTQMSIYFLIYFNWNIRSS